MNYVTIDSSVFDNPPNDPDLMRGIVISKNNEAYTLELDEFGNYIFGDCQISSHYRLNNDIYDERCICSSDYTKPTGEECDNIQDNTNYISSSCTYKESVNPKCVSCSFQTTDDSDGETTNACIYDDSYVDGEI